MPGSLGLHDGATEDQIFDIWRAELLRHRASKESACAARDRFLVRSQECSVLASAYDKPDGRQPQWTTQARNHDQL